MPQTVIGGIVGDIVRLSNIAAAIPITGSISFSQLYDIPFTDGNVSSSSGTISLSEFKGKTIGSGINWKIKGAIISDTNANRAAITGSGLTVAYSTSPGVKVLQYISGTWTQIGSTFNTANGSQLVRISNSGTRVLVSGVPGVVYFYEYTTDWNLMHTIIGSPAQNFGFSIDLSADGNTAVVGEPGNQGTVFIYKYSGSWVLAGTIAEPEGRLRGYQFGHAVSVSSDGSYIGVGAPNYYGLSGPNNGLFAGLFAIYQYGGGTTWNQTFAIPSVADDVYVQNNDDNQRGYNARISDDASAWCYYAAFGSFIGTSSNPYIAPASVDVTESMDVSGDSTRFVEKLGSTATIRTIGGSQVGSAISPGNTLRCVGLSTDGNTFVTVETGVGVRVYEYA